jgi:alkanesulfonate monooxygenase SsuD/methylene tetrahydromethanopterin reductase-like flavin-dependent oxidoreductase (luciferase family)
LHEFVACSCGCTTRLPGKLGHDKARDGRIGRVEAILLDEAILLEERACCLGHPAQGGAIVIPVPKTLQRGKLAPFVMAGCAVVYANRQGAPSVRFGIFGGAQAVRGGPDVDSGMGFRQFVEHNIEAEAIGYHSSFVVEHHFTGFGQISATLNLLTWIGARTTTLRLGTAVLALPWHNPVLLAEQTATIDLLSGGRLDLGVGKGYRHNEFAGFCISMAEAEARFEESIAVITKAWTCDSRWSHHGRFWRFEEIVVEPPTKQKPHPPIWVGAGSPASIRKVAARGYNLLLDQFASLEETGARIALYKSELEAQGGGFDPMRVGVTRSVNIVTTAAERTAAVEARMAARRRTEQLAQTPDGRNRASIMSYADTREATEESALYGTPDEIVAKLQVLQNLGARYVLLNPAGGMATLRRFAREVMPAFG